MTIKDLTCDWRASLDVSPPNWQTGNLYKSTRTGRPCADPDSITQLETKFGRRLS